MKKNYFSWVILFLFCLTVSYAQAQPPMGGRGPGMPDSTQIVKMVDDLAVKLKLSDDVKKKVLDLQLAHFSELTKLRSDDSGDREARREKMRGMRDKLTTQIKALLTPEQATEYDKYLEEQRSQRMRSGPPPGGPRP